MQDTLNTIKVVYTYNGKEFTYADLLKDNLSTKDLDIISWKASKFFNATPRSDVKTDKRETVNA